MLRRVAAVVVVAGLGLAGLAAQPGTSPETGQLRPRPGEGREPEWPAPSIREYRPRSTLVVAEHPTPRARYPVVDVHSHQPVPITAEQFDRVVRSMDALGLQVLVNLSGGSGERLRRGLEAIRTSAHADRMVLFASVDFRGGVGPGFGARAAAQLDEDIRAGALGLKVYKDLGLRLARTDGSRLPVDDPELGPIWDVCGRLGVPVLIHTAEPQAFFDPIDYRNERWLELALFRERRYPPERFPRFEDVIAERDRMFAAHPKTTFIMAHMGYHANDLARMGRLLDRLPNVYADVAAVLAELGRQPRAARASWRSTRTASSSARTATSPTSSRTTGGRSRRPTSTSTTTATTTRSGSCTGSTCPTRSCASSTTATP